MSLHPQVAALLERAARSPLPPYHSVPAFVPTAGYDPLVAVCCERLRGAFEKRPEKMRA